MKPSRKNILLRSLLLGALTATYAHSSVTVADELLVDLRADDSTAGTATWTNNGTLGDFTVLSGNPVKNNSGGVDYVSMDPGTQYVGPNAPSSVTGAATRSVEVWVRNPDVGFEEILVAWGKRGGPDLTNYATSYGFSEGWGALGGWGSGDVPWGPPGVGIPAANQLHHLVYTYDGTATRVYANGELRNSRVHSLNTYNDPNRFLINGAWEGNNVDVQRPNNGNMDYAVIRVHSGLLSPDDVQDNFAAGVDGVVVSANVWTGNTNSDWATAGNWSFNAIPNGTDPVAFGDAGAEGTVNLGAANRTVPSADFKADTPTTISGTGMLVFSNGADAGLIKTAGSHIINAPLRLDSSVLANVGGSTGSLELRGAISGSGGLAKSGGGLLILTGNSTYTGPTSVSAGELSILEGSLASFVTVNSGGKLTGSGRSASGTLNVAVENGGRVLPGDTPSIIGDMRLSSLELGAGSILEYEFDADFGVNDRILINGQLISSGAGFILRQEGNAMETHSEPGTYTLMSFTSALAEASEFTVLNKIPGRNYEFALTANALNLTISSGPIWDGGAGGNANWSNAANWGGVTASNGNTLVFASAPSAPASVNDIAGGNFASIVYQDSASAYTLTGNAITLGVDAFGNAIQNLSPNTQTLDLPLTLSAPGARIDTSGGAVVLNSALSGSGGFVKSGANLLTIAGNNNHSGGSGIASGPVLMTSAGGLGTGPFSFTGGSLDNATGGTLTVPGNIAQSWAGEITFAGSPMDFGTGQVTVTGNTIVNINNGGLVLGSLDGSGTLIKRGGPLSLTGSGGALAVLNIESGLLNLTSGNPTITLNGGDAFRIRGGNSRMVMDQGTLNITQTWRLGHDDSQGSAIVTGGEINHTGGIIDLGFNGGQGYILLDDNAKYNGNGRELRMGGAWQSNTRYDVTGDAGSIHGDAWVGAWNAVPNSTNAASINVSGNGTFQANTLIIARESDNQGLQYGQFNQESGVSTINNAVLMGHDRRNLNSILEGTLNLRGGVFRTPRISGAEIGNNQGGATVNFLGGTLEYNGGGNQANFIRLGANGRAVVYNDTTINTGSHEVTIQDPLLAPTGSGVSSIAVAAAGSNYLVPPAVLITGDGVGATAVAQYDAATQTITGVHITNPGTGYTTPPFATFYRGVGAGALISSQSNQIPNAGSVGAAGNTTTFQGTGGVPGALAGSDSTAFSFTREQEATVPQNAALNPNGPFTVEAWLKPSQADGAVSSPLASFKEQADGIGRHGWLIYEFGNKWNFRTYNGDGGNTAANIYSNDDIVNDSWYHIAVVWDGSVASMYVNGVLQNEVSPAVGFTPNLTTPLSMGSRGFGAFQWAGSIDEAAVYPAALDAATIAARHANGIDAGRTTPYPTLVQANNPLAYWSGNVELLGEPGVALASNNTYNGGITKTGSGKLILAAANTYRGNTVVNQGTLTLAHPSLADDANVTIAEGATLELTHAGTDTIGSLVINNTAVAAGVWGAPGSGAANTSPQLAGSGLLNVTGGGVVPDSAFNTWMNGFAGLTPAQREATADPDGDGVNNLLEFALRGDPTDATNNGLSLHVLQNTNAVPGDELTLVAAVRRGATFAAGPDGSVTATRDGVAYTIQGSLDLAAFNAPVSHVSSSDTAPAGTGLPSLAGTDWQYQTFRLDGSDGLNGKGFLRVSVVAAP